MPPKYRKRTTRKRKYGSKGLTLKKVNQKVKKMQSDVELKYTDTQFGVNVTTAGQLFLLNGIPRGDSQAGRIGSQVHNTSIQGRFRIRTNIANITAPTTLRMIIFWDRQANGLIPQIGSDPFATSDPALLDIRIVQAVSYAPFQRETSDRFRVLYDKLFTINPPMQREVTPATGLIASTFLYETNGKVKIPLSRTTKYDTAGNLVADINTNSLYVCFITELNANGPNVYGGFRLYYKDA